MANILDHSLISHCYFFPSDDEATNVCVIQTRDGLNLRCASLKGETTRTVLHFHGNGETASDWEPILGPFFVDCGWSVVFVEYRGYGGSDGVPKLAGMLSDGEDVIRALGLSPQNTVAFGRSIGSLYAVELARRLPLAGVILDSGINDLKERLLFRVTPDELGVSEAFFDKAIDDDFDQSKKLSSYAGPVLILHASDDQLVDVTHAKRNAQACRRPTMRLFDHGGHNAIYPANRREYQAALRDFLSTVAGSP